MAKVKKNELIRVSINLPNNLVERVKKYSNDLGINVTSAYIVLLNQALDQKNVLEELPQLYSIMSSLNKLGESSFTNNEKN